MTEEENLSRKHYFASYLSELLGSFFFVHIFMISTDKETQISKDKVINAFIISAAYIASKLLGGGPMVSHIYIKDTWKNVNQVLVEIPHHVIKTGPLLNPAIAFG